MTPKALTDDQVRTIRRLARDKRRHYPLKVIAERMGVSDTIVGKVVRGEIYTDVPDEEPRKGVNEKEQGKKCRVCGSWRVPHKKYNDYCWRHIPDDLRCVAVTKQGNRCKNPLLPNTMLCTTHTRANRPTRQERLSRNKLPGGRGPGLVYVVELGRDNYYKIGQSVNIERRLESLRAANPWASLVFCIPVYNASWVERNLHETFRHKRLEREIFRLDAVDLDTVYKVLEKHKYNGTLD